MRAVALLAEVPTRWGGLTLSREVAVHWILRVGVAWCFVGHGAFGVWHGGKAEWLVYFYVFGIPDHVAWRLMPLIGTLDISIGLLTLVNPLRAPLVWAAVWGLWTALLRPLAGQGVWEEVFERAGNYGVPFALLYLSGVPRTLHALARESALPQPLDVQRARTLAWILRVSTALLLIGHGGYGAFMHKAVWVGYLGALGIDAGTVQRLALLPAIGWFEVALGLAVLVRPVGSLLLFVFVWKVGTEGLRLMVGEPVFEFVERGGSYAAPLALYVLTRWLAAPRGVERLYRVATVQADEAGSSTLAAHVAHVARSAREGLR